MPITGMPPGQNASFYPDMQSEWLIGSIETQGVRLAWSRATSCACAPVNAQTQQPDPNCPLCQGEGTFYFVPPDYVLSADAGELTEVQQAILDNGAALIRGIVGKSHHIEEFYDPLGRWRWGKMFVAVRPENRIGFHDRLVNLDSIIVHSESVIVEANSAVVPTRYTVIDLTMMRSLTTVYSSATDYTIVNGVITLDPTVIPTEDTRLSVHYTTHPTWLVTDSPHAIRETSRRIPAPGSTGAYTPLGTVTALPLLAQIELEMIPIED